MEMGLFNNYKIDLDKETQKAQQEAFIGYVIIDILDEEGPEWKRNEINARDIDQNQAMLLIGHFLETKCEPMRNWLVASIEGEDAFETLDESPLEFATSPYSATKVKVVGNVWRVAGNHRMWGIRKYFKACRVGASQSTSLTEAMDEVGEGNVLLMGNRNTTAEAKATFEKILELIQNEWRYWPVAVYWRSESCSMILIPCPLVLTSVCMQRSLWPTRNPWQRYAAVLQAIKHPISTKGPQEKSSK